MSKVAPGPSAEASGGQSSREWSGGDSVRLAIPELTVATPPPAAPLLRSPQRAAAASATRTFLGGDQVQLFFDAPPDQLYYAGETITGRAVFTATSSVRLQDADVTILCECSAKKVSGGAGDNVTYTISNTLYERTTELSVPPRVAAGEVLSLPFSIAIPMQAPPTLLLSRSTYFPITTSLNASVVHTIRATVRANESWLYKDVAAAATFAVGSHALSVLEPAEGSEDQQDDCLPPYSNGVVDEEDDCCCCSGGLLALGIAMPTRVLLIGSPRSHGQAQFSFASAIVPFLAPRRDNLLAAPASTVKLVCVTTVTFSDTHLETITEVVAETRLPAAPVGTPHDPLQLFASHLDLAASGAAMRPTTSAREVSVAYHIEFSRSIFSVKKIPVLVTNNPAALPSAAPPGAASGNAKKGRKSGKKDKVVEV